MINHSIDTLGKLKQSGYTPKTIKQELRDNLINNLKIGKKSFEGIHGYDDTVIPEIQRAILSQHNINLLGLRGQAKTKLARLMVQLLDEYIPVVKDSELNDDPLNPISVFAKNLINELGDNTPIAWMHRSERYTEKLATPDVSVADLIGDADPIKAANLKLPYSDERVIHYGLIPRAHRGLFVINELPDLQARIQVALFNILQEGDIQIRGFKIRLPLDIQFVFTANPEDYTNRGSIITPLKDRIDSQIITHYPKTLALVKAITQQEAKIHVGQENIKVHELIKDLVEQIAIEARKSEYVDEKSGVSARLTIAAYENTISAAERRMLITNASDTHTRIGDLYGAIPAITGKVELVYEGEQEGAAIVATNLVGMAIRTQYLNYFPDPEKLKKLKDKNPLTPIVDWFREGNVLELDHDMDDKTYHDKLYSIPGLYELVNQYHENEHKETKKLLMEFALHALAEYSLISKNALDTAISFKDLMDSMFSGFNPDDLEDNE